MYEWYYSDSEDADAALDELLCEYVDGTMDPCVREVFEECLCDDHELAEQVQELRCTRMMLCCYGYRSQMPDDLRRRLRKRLSVALAGERVQHKQVNASDAASRVGLSSVSAALLIGLLVGSVFLIEPPVSAPTDAAPTATAMDAPPNAPRVFPAASAIFESPLQSSRMLPAMMMGPLNDTLSLAVMQSHP